MSCFCYLQVHILVLWLATRTHKMLLASCIPLKPHVLSIRNHRSAELTWILKDHSLISIHWERTENATLEDIISHQGRRFQISFDRLFWHFPPLLALRCSPSYFIIFLSDGGHCKPFFTVHI